MLDQARTADELDALDGFRYALQLVSEASELFVEGDPERPRFTSIVSPSRKFLGDNPDAIYHQALIRGDRSYRVTGRRDREVYISFTVHGPDPKGGINGPVLADLNDRSFTVAPDGSYELVLGGRGAPRQLGAARPERAHRARAQLLPRAAVGAQRPVGARGDRASRRSTTPARRR